MQLNISVISVSQSGREDLEAGSETFPAVFLENTSWSEVWLQLLWELKLLPAFSQRGCSVFAEEAEAGGVCFRIWVSPISGSAWRPGSDQQTSPQALPLAGAVWDDLTFGDCCCPQVQLIAFSTTSLPITYDFIIGFKTEWMKYHSPHI